MCKNGSGGAAGSATTRSHDKLRTAVTGLLDDHGPEQVTITDIVNAAGVTRPTFYAVYGDLPTAFADAALHRLADAFEEFSPEAGVGATASASASAPLSEASSASLADDMGRVLLSIVTHLERHAEFFSRTLRGPGGHRVMAEIISFIAERLDKHSMISAPLHEGPLPAAEAASALAAGATWITLGWIDTEPRRAAAEFAGQLRDFILHAVFDGLSNSPRPGDTHTPVTGDHRGRSVA